MPYARFKKSGVAYGYGYNFQEIGFVQEVHKQRLIDAGVIEVIADTPAQFEIGVQYETPEKLTPKIQKRDLGSSKRAKR
jgi:hypothetical protein